VLAKRLEKVALVEKKSVEVALPKIERPKLALFEKRLVEVALSEMNEDE